MLKLLKDKQLESKQLNYKNSGINQIIDIINSNTKYKNILPSDILTLDNSNFLTKIKKTVIEETKPSSNNTASVKNTPLATNTASVTNTPLPFNKQKFQTKKKKQTKKNGIQKRPKIR